jgi:hypothetical protein
MTTVLDFLADQLADAKTSWSVGTFGAIAEFIRDADEPMTLERDGATIMAVTARGGLRLTADPALRPIATESPTPESWNHRVALCLPQTDCAMNGRSELSEIGPDGEALRTADRAGVLFDLGLGTLQVDAHVRASDPDVIAALRGCTGRSIFAPDSGAMAVIMAAQPHRVFVSRIGRAEVYQPIPSPGGESPAGPHTHVLPKLLAHGRTHAATEPLPLGWVPCAHCFPPHPTRDSLDRRHHFRREHHDAFQTILARYGVPEQVELKRRVVASIVAGQEPPAQSIAGDRLARATIRVALRQLQAADPSTASLAAWLSAYDRLDPNEDVNPLEAPH